MCQPDVGWGGDMVVNSRLAATALIACAALVGCADPVTPVGPTSVPVYTQDGPGEVTQDPPSPSSSDAAQVDASNNATTVFTSKDGDTVQVSVAAGTWQPGRALPADAAGACSNILKPERAMALPVQIQTTLTSPLPADVIVQGETFQDSSDQLLQYVYDAGSCSPGGIGSRTLHMVPGSAPNTTTVWVIAPDSVTPSHPQGDPSKFANGLGFSVVWPNGEGTEGRWSGALAAKCTSAVRPDLWFSPSGGSCS